MPGREAPRNLPGQMRPDRSTLTPREIQILSLVASGRTNREIGTSLAITEGTVKGHLQRIYRKMRVENRAQAATLHRKLETPPHLPADVAR
jgi:DNA-binding CsgD family transcriptional regulator